MRHLVISAVVLAIGVIAGWQLHAVRPAASAAEDPEGLARVEVERFYAGTAGKVPLAEILGEGFQLIRSDGTRSDRSGYLANPASLQTYELGDFKATRTGDTLIATFNASFQGMVEGVQYDVVRSPRLAVFTQVDGSWKLQAFANLGFGSAISPEGEARKAVESWLGAVASGDKNRISSVLAPEFQISRADGSAYRAAEYLESDLPKITGSPAVENLIATGYGDLLVTRYQLTIDETIGGKAMKAVAPRLTVFRRSEGAWLVVAHANFAEAAQ
jgi:ketosteroid isomerase-like protein